MTLNKSSLKFKFAVLLMCLFSSLILLPSQTEVSINCSHMPTDYLTIRSHNDTFLRGVSFTGFSKDAFLSDFSNQSLEQLKNDGGEWVAICFWWFSDNVSSTIIYPDFDWYSCSNNSITTAIAKAKELDMKIMLKPMIDLKSGDWRAYIEPSTEWFIAYKSFISSWAHFAELLEVELLCIGCEYSLSESFSDEWRDIATEVRLFFSGELIYASNHDAYFLVDWWDVLDYIGVDAYYQLSNTNTPILETLTQSWLDISEDLASFADANQMKIVFTEVGFRSIDGCNRWPWDWERDAKVDLEEQRMCYEATFRALWGKNWFGGLFWWDWTPDERDNWLKDKDYTCQFKPAEDVLKSWYNVEFGINPNYSFTSEVTLANFLLFVNTIPLIFIMYRINKRKADAK